MERDQLLTYLFGEKSNITHRGDFFFGSAQVGEQEVTIIGTSNRASVGTKLILEQSTVMIDTMKNYPGRPIIFLIDTQGQNLRHLDELLGLNCYMAHLGKCIELARQRGHHTIGIVYGEAVSGGFITSGMMSDQCYALSEAIIKVMGLPAMARITKIPLEKLENLSTSNPVFAPGADNYYKMGSIHDIWDENENLHDKLIQALKLSEQKEDKRSEIGSMRGGRTLAHHITQSIIDEH